MWRSGVRELRRNLWAFAGVRSSKSLVAAEAKGGNATGNVFLLACTGIGAGVSAGFLGHIYTSSTSSDRRLSFVDLVTSCSSEASRLLRGCYATRTLSCSQVECAERTYSVEQVLRASRDVWEATEGVVMLFTNSTSKGGAPAGRPVKCFKTPELDKSSEGESDSDASWCDRLWIPTNVYSKKVDELNRNSNCSIAAYDRFGNYFVMEGEVVEKVTVDSGAFYKSVLNGIWEEHDEHLWEYFQDGPNSKRFVLIEFVPLKVSLISNKFCIANEANSWQPAEIRRSSSSSCLSANLSSGSKWSWFRKKTAKATTAQTVDLKLGSWKTISNDSQKHIKKLRGNFDIEGKPIPT